MKFYFGGMVIITAGFLKASPRESLKSFLGNIVIVSLVESEISIIAYLKNSPRNSFKHINEAV